MRAVPGCGNGETPGQVEIVLYGIITLAHVMKTELYVLGAEVLV